MKLFCSWDSLKQIQINNTLIMYYYQNFDYYEIILINNNTTWYTEIWTNISNIAGINITENNNNLIDFENNFKTNSQKL